jgi:hypothetical protein
MKLKCIVYCLKFLLPLIFLPVTLTSQAQNSNLLNVNSLNSSGVKNNQSLTERQIEYIQKSYSEKVEAPKEFINGKEYESYYIRSKSKPLLYPDKKRTATLITRTRRYNNLTLQYDTFLDEVVYTDPGRTINFRFPQIALNKDILDGFNLYFDDDSLIFRYCREPECSKFNLKEGFYEIAYTGKSRLFIKHTSSFYVREGLNEYKYRAEKYVSSGDRFFLVKSKGDLLKILGNKSAEMKKYLHMTRIRIRQADKSQFVEILKYYDSLTASSR